MSDPSGSPDPYDAPPERVDLKGRTRVQRIVRRIEVALILSVLLAAAVIGGIGYWGWTHYQSPGPLAEERIVVVPSGAGLRMIARTLADEGVIARPEVFMAAAKLTGLHDTLKAGEYGFEPGVSPQQVLAKLTVGETVDRFVTIPEGLTSRQIVDLLAQTDALTGEVAEIPAEGTLLPETYHYERGVSRGEMIRRMQAAMEEAVDALWESRAPDLPFETKREAVILASIIEKETGVGAERAKVGGVFVNRLARGMRLQSDPTVIYALTEGAGPLDRALTRADWKVEHPYNTYQNAGLPPGPIANPGRQSLQAALNPAETDALYFVADGTGGHAFARTLEEHNRNVARWRRIRDGRE
ncbi:MAG: endolytic transglycosylase MltG [Marivibrio sp.]|uniref:endolytic transglycosylase MltG n=1 Tax=Marivibrio sp. TaxID=2039719 RepID=UPI0032EB2A4A